MIASRDQDGGLIVIDTMLNLATPWDHERNSFELGDECWVDEVTTAWIKVVIGLFCRVC